MTRKNNIQLTHDQHTPSGRLRSLCLLAHDIEDAANVGSLFRLADAMGVEHIYLSGSTPAPPDNRLHRASRSTDRAVAFSVEHDPLAVIDSLKSDAYRVVSLELTTTSIDLDELLIESGDRICLIVGSENKGIEQILLDASEQTVHIPMLGQNSSMNVAMATAIAVYEISRHLVLR